MKSNAENRSSTLPGIELDDLTGSSNPGHNGKVDNITDWALAYFREQYKDDSISKDDIWHYMYGALHAQDWRDKYESELRKHLPRIPLTATPANFRELCEAGIKLMELHLNYENITPWPLGIEIDGKACSGETLTAKTHKEPDVYRISPKMRWGRLPEAKSSGHRTEDRSILIISERCRIVGIPAVAGNPYRGEDALDIPLSAADDNTMALDPYIVNGKTPLEWAINQLQITTHKESEIVNDPNKWHVWAADEDAHKLVLHLLRLVRVSVETAQIVASLPAMPLADD